MEKKSITTSSITRPYLIGLLHNQANYGLTILTAKKGYGKNTLINQWIGQSKSNFIRLSLSSYFNQSTDADIINKKHESTTETERPTKDIDQFWATIALSIEKHFKEEIRSHCSSEIIKFLNSKGRLSQKACPSENFVIIIDEYQNSSHLLDEVLCQFIKATENKIGIIVSTTQNPPKLLFQFMASQQALYLSEDQLRFTRTELIELMLEWKKLSDHQYFVIENSVYRATLIETLYCYLGGWPALVQLTYKTISQSNSDTEIVMGNRFNDLINQALFHYIETNTLQPIAEELKNAYISTAQLPLITPRLASQLKPINSNFSLMNLFYDKRLLKVTKRFRSEYVDCLPILKDFRLNKLLNNNNNIANTSTLIQSNIPPASYRQLLDSSKKWYLQNGHIAEIIYSLINFQNWHEAVDLFESNIDYFFSQGDWHIISDLTHQIPLTHLTDKASFLAKLTYSHFLGQRLEHGYKLLGLFVDVYEKQPLTKNCKTDLFTYLYQFGKNFLNDSNTINDHRFKPENSAYQKTTSQNITFYQYLPTMPNNLSTEIAPCILLLECYRQAFQEKDLTEAINRAADCLEIAIDQDDTVLAFQSLVTYIYLTEQAGELKNIYHCCSILHAWAESKRYCGFSIGLILRFLNTPYTNERTSQVTLNDEAFTLSKLIENCNFDVDPLLEYVIFRSLTILFNIIGSQKKIQQYQDKIKAISLMISSEFISISSCPYHTISPRVIWQSGDYLKLGDYFNQLQRNIYCPEQPLPPFDIESQQYILLEKHRKILDCKAFDRQMSELRSQSQYHSSNFSTLMLTINHAIFLYRTRHEQALEIMKEALSIGSTLGYCRTVVMTNRVILEWLPYTTSELHEQSHYIHTLMNIGRNLPTIQQQDYFCSSPIFKLSSGLQILSKREREILSLLVTGMSNEEIANHLHRSVNTIKLHIHKIFKKLGTKNRMETTNLYRDKISNNQS